MTGIIITVAQQKGGAGKTTVAAHLAISLAAANRRVAILDTDPQGSLSQWWELRTTLLGPSGLGPSGVTLQHHATGGLHAADVIATLKQSFDAVVVDSPPHAEAEAKIVIRAADLVVVPLQPSALDLWATRATLELAKAEQRPSLLVLNRVPPRSGLAVEMIAGAAQFGTDIAEAQLGNRVGFAAAMALGQAVTETAPGTVAAREAARLAREVATRAGMKRPPQR